MDVVIESNGVVTDGGSFTCPTGTEILLLCVYSRNAGAVPTSITTCTYNSDSMRRVEHVNSNAQNTIYSSLTLFYLKNPDTGSSYVADWTTSAHDLGAMWVALSNTDVGDRVFDNLLGNYWSGYGGVDSDYGDKEWSGLRGSSGGSLISFWTEGDGTPTVGTNGDQTILDSGSRYMSSYVAGDGTDVNISIDNNNSILRSCVHMVVDIQPPRDFEASYKVSLDASYIEASHTDLFVPIFGTFADSPDLRSAANGGSVQAQMYSLFEWDRLIPADVIFTSDSSGNTNLEHVVVEWDASTGYIYAWVKVPSLDSTSGTKIYMWVGDSGAGNNEHVDVFDAAQYFSPDGGEHSYVSDPVSITTQAGTDFADGITYHAKGTLSGSAAWSGSGKASSQALSCAGGSDGLLTNGGGNTGGLPERTLWTLFKPATGGDTDPHIFRTRNEYGFDIIVDTSLAEYVVESQQHYNGTVRDLQGGTISNGSWYWGASVWDYGTVNEHRIFLNNTDITNVAVTGNASGDASTILNWGEAYDGTGNFSGLIELCAIITEYWKDESKTIYNFMFSQTSAVTVSLNFIPKIIQIL